MAKARNEHHRMLGVHRTAVTRAAVRYAQAAHGEASDNAYKALMAAVSGYQAWQAANAERSLNKLLEDAHRQAGMFKSVD